MAKRVSGERSIKVGSKTHVLRLDFQALADIEDFIDGPITDYFKRKKEPRLKEIAALFGYLAHIPPEDAWEVVKAYGLPESVEIITECIISTLMPEGTEPGKAKARQPKTAA